MAKSRPPLERLERTIASRAANPNQKSYTSQLLAAGVAKMGAKVTEEAGEVAEAAAEPGDEGREHFIREVGDLFYHLLVLMRHRDCGLAEIETELARRFGVSGLKEKASRTSSPAEAVDGAPSSAAEAKVPRKKAKPKVKPKVKPKPKTKARRTTAKGK